MALHFTRTVTKGCQLFWTNPMSSEVVFKAPENISKIFIFFGGGENWELQILYMYWTFAILWVKVHTYQLNLCSAAHSGNCGWVAVCSATTSLLSPGDSADK